MESLEEEAAFANSREHAICPNLARLRLREPRLPRGTVLTQQGLVC